MRSFPTVRIHGRLIFLLMVLLGTVTIWSTTVLVPSLVPSLSRTVTTVGAQPKPGDELTIPKLTLAVPIVRNVSVTDEAAYLAALEHGVAQSADSASPDQPGNLFIFGHSSYFRDRPGDFKEAFKTLDQLAPTDRFTLQLDGRRYEYDVVSTAVVAPTDWSILTPQVDGADRTLTLMTCWPPGSLAKRLAVVAKQVSAEPGS